MGVTPHMTTFAFLLAADAQSSAEQVERTIGVLAGLAFLVAVPLAFILSIIFAFRTKHAGWIVATVLTGLLTLGLGGIFAFGFVKGFKSAIQSRGAAPAADGTIVSDDGSVSIVAPPTWRKLDNLNEAAELQAGNASREEYLIVLTDSKEDFAGTLADHSATTLANILGGIADSEAFDAVELTVNGLPALQREVRGTVENLNVNYLHTSVEGARGYHQILAWTLHSKRSTAMPALRQATESFREIAATKSE